MHLLYVCWSLFYVWIMKSYNFHQGNVLSDFSFVKMLCCLPDFLFSTVHFSDIAEIAFDLFCIYFADFGESKIRTFTLCKIEVLIVVLLVPYKPTMVINTFLIILIKIIQKDTKSIDMWYVWIKKMTGQVPKSQANLKNRVAFEYGQTFLNI